MIKSKRILQVGTYSFFVAPALLVFLAVIAFPVFFSVGLSFTDYNIYKNTATLVGLEHYKEIFTHDVFWLGLKNNLIVVCVSVFLQIPLGFILAYVLYRKFVRLASFFQSMVFLPITISTIIVGILFQKMFSPIGAVTGALRQLMNDPNYVIAIFNNKQLAMLPIAIVLVWMYTGFFMVVFLANLQKIDPALIEAASIDGASELQTISKVILPNLAGIIVTMIIFAIAGSLKSFDLIYAMTQGGPAHYTEVLAIYMYNHTFGQISDYGYGSAVSTVIVLVSVVLISVVKFIGAKVDYEGEG